MNETEETGIAYRPAKPTDCVVIFALLKRMHKESPVVLAPVNEPKAIMVIVQAIRDGRAFVALADGGRRIVGAVGAIMETPWWSSGEHASGLWWYVLPDYRETGAGAQLLRLLGAEVTGPLRMDSGGAGAERDDRMEALYWRLAGLKRVGSVYMRGA